MKLEFWGAARTVTGSAHLLTVNAKTTLLDCGLFQGRRQQARQMNQSYASPAFAADAVVLSHAHLDHSGNLPQLVKAGFRGRVHCTRATADLARILLLDSGHIQQKDAEFLNRRLRRQQLPEIEPLYTPADAERTLGCFEPAGYREAVEVIPGCVQAEFFDAGHILGSAFVKLSLSEGGRQRALLFSGDLGRYDMPILRDPEQPPEADCLILESTYGNRDHEDYEQAEAELAAHLQRVVERRGKVVIPAFSIGRTQEIVYALNNLWNAGKLPRIPVYVDSPMSANATEAFRRHPECYNEQVRKTLASDPDPFGFESLTYVRDVEASKRLNAMAGPCVIISASGMCEAGRILHHLSNTIGDPRNAVMIVGFQAENTLGRKLVERQPEVKIFGEPHKVRAEVITMNAFSAHAGRAELRRFAAQAAASGRLKKIFLVHGEEQAMLAFQQVLAADLPQCEVFAPQRGESFEL